jgi:mannose-6-phosphate isomerase-like protein (cupin superfamily)
MWQCWRSTCCLFPLRRKASYLKEADKRLIAGRSLPKQQGVFIMPGIVPAIPLGREPDPKARLVDHYPDSANAKPRHHGWGKVEVLSCSGGHRVERISVKNGKQLLPHYHKFRSEHWTIVEGEAEVVLGDDVLIVAPDDSLYIPAGTVHGLKPLDGQGIKIVAVHFGDTVSDADDMFDAA